MQNRLLNVILRDLCQEPASGVQSRSQTEGDKLSTHLEYSAGNVAADNLFTMIPVPREKAKKNTDSGWHITNKLEIPKEFV